VRLCSIDYHMSYPVEGLDVIESRYMGERLQRVPILRIFGITSEGQKACVHLHRAFPYLYVPVLEQWCSLAPAQLDSRIKQLAKSMDMALKELDAASSMDQEREGGDRGRRKPKQHVLKAQVLRGTPFYGCHLSQQLFVKI
ncbi:hypothetical protein GUITHDRAFT_54961, partial [Guillardia theta CCMP2712]